jgi:predicted amidohydrolase YtcJ
MIKLPLICITLLLCLKTFAQKEIVHDIVITGGRVIDPETKLDAIRNVGIVGGKISQISSGSLKGKETINATGFVVAPGFIDMHIHGRSNTEQEYQAHDGVTTALELEWGVAYLKDWYASRESKAIINYGASVNWPFERFRVLDNNSTSLQDLLKKTQNGSATLRMCLISLNLLIRLTWILHN